MRITEWFKKWMVVLTALLIVCGSMPSAFAEELNEDSGMVSMLENERFILNVNESTGQFNVENKASGKLWWSTPPDAASDSMAGGRNRMELQSNLIIRYADADDNEIDLTNTYTGAVVPGTVEVSKQGDGVRIAYKMNSVRLYIPLYIHLNDDGITCTIRTDEILEGGHYSIYSISLLPFFGAGYHDESGYLFIPDGSGAVVEFDLKKRHYSQYREPVYGTDYNFDVVRQTTVKETIRMPVYGIHQENDGFLGIVTEGSGIAQIEASACGSGTGYGNVFSTFHLRYIGTYYMGQSLGGTTRPINLFDRNPILMEKVEVRKIFLEGEDSGYVGMAKAYRRHLLETHQITPLTPVAPEIHLEIIGTVRKQERFLGIPLTVTKTVTDFDQVREITDRLIESGIDGNRIAVNYIDWEQSSVKGILSARANPVWGTGGRAGLRDLSRYLEDVGVQLYLDRDLMLADRFSTAYPKTRNATLSISKKVVSLYQYSYVNYYKERLVKPSFLVSPSSIGRVFADFLENYQKLSVPGISLGQIGNILYSDFRSSDFNRNDAVAEMVKVADRANKEHSVMVRGGNAYMFPHTDRIIDAPVSSSHFDISDYSVPFYQMVLYGSIHISSVPINRSDNPTIELLRAIESLSSIHFLWIASDMKDLKDSKYSQVGSADYRDWIDLAVRFGGELAALYEMTEGSDIRNHQIVQPGVRVVTWENGLVITINYNDEERTVEGILIPAQDYRVLQQED